MPEGVPQSEGKVTENITSFHSEFFVRGRGDSGHEMAPRHTIADFNWEGLSTKVVFVDTKGFEEQRNILATVELGLGQNDPNVRRHQTNLILPNLEAGCRLNNELAVMDLDGVANVHSVNFCGPLHIVDQVKCENDIALTYGVNENQNALLVHLYL